MPRVSTPPKVSYHFGRYADLAAYGRTSSALSDTAWQKIPSVVRPPGGAYRSGLYVAQHPGYAERYAAEQGGIGDGPWMLTVTLDDECIDNTSRWFDLTTDGLGADCPPEQFRAGATNSQACLEKANRYVKDNGIGVMVDTWWSEFGFWYVTDRICLRAVDATPDGFLQAAATVGDFWGLSPYTSDEPRDKGAGSGYVPGEISFAILARALADSPLNNRRLLNDLALNAKKSDLAALKRPLAVVTEYALACFDARQLPAFKRELTGFLAGLPKTAGAANGGSEEASERPNAEPNEEASKAGAGSGLSIASAIDDLARRRLAGLAGVCPGVKAKMTGVPPAPLGQAAPNEVTEANGNTPVAPSNQPQGPRIACERFQNDENVCNTKTNGQCVYSVVNDYGARSCLPKDGACNTFSRDERACSANSLDRCVYAVVNDYGAKACIPRDGDCGTFSRDENACAKFSKGRCAFAVVNDYGAKSCISKAGACNTFSRDERACNDNSTGRCVFAVVNDYGAKSCIAKSGACETFSRDERACNDNSEGRCVFAVVNSYGAKGCIAKSSACNQFNNDATSCEHATGRRCVWAQVNQYGAKGCVPVR